MNVESLFKRKLFWLKDILFNGAEIYSQYKNITDTLSDYNKGVTNQKRALEDILNYAVDNTKYYQGYECIKISDFPVMNKSLINENYDDIVVNEKNIPGQKGSVYIQRTSGSTGTPFSVPQDHLKRKRRVAELKVFGERANFQSHDRLIQLRIWNQWQNKNQRSSFWENIHPINCSVMNDDTLSDLVNVIEKENTVAMLGYASWFDKFIQYISENRIKITSIKSIIAVSEMLEDDTRERINNLLNCKVVSRYSNEEQGILGQDNDSSSGFILNHSSYYFEVLELNNNEPVQFGEMGRIVITDLYNKALPLIRYDTGDLGIMIEGNDESKGFPILKKLFGRKLDVIYDCDGNPIHPMFLSRTLKNYSHIKQWQFIQKSTMRYELKLITQEKKSIEKCLNELKNLLGDKSKIDVKFVDGIPVLSSGKRKSVICEI